MQALVRATAAALEGQGHDVEEHDLGFDAARLWQTYTDMTCVETAAAYGYYEGLLGRKIGPGDVEPVTQAVIDRGRATDAISHARRIESLRVMGRALATEMAPYDLFLTPVLTQPPRPVGFYDMTMTDLDAYNALWADAVFMTPFNITGQPAMALPLGLAGGLPCGVQLVGRHGQDATVLAAATLLEQTDALGRPPPAGQVVTRVRPETRIEASTQAVKV